MKVYFVRHGQSELGEGYHQLPETPLSETGVKQVKFAAQRLKNIPMDLIITSSYRRAFQTAQEIEKIKPVQLIQSDLLIERKMPSIFLNKKVDDIEIKEINRSMRAHFYEPDWHYAEEENFTDLLSRAKAVFELILSQKKENILVVTHGYFLTVLVYVLLFGENIIHQSFKSFREHTANSNTGVTLCEFKDEKWKLLTWNDIAHLDKLIS